MGRVKIPPAERSASLSEAMKASATQILPPTAADIFGNVTNTRTTKGNSKSALPTPRGSQDRALSEPAAKRKVDSDSGNKKVANKDGNPLLRSNLLSHSTSSPSSTTAIETNNPFDSAVGDSPPAKRQKVDETPSGPRRSARTSRPVIQQSTPTSTRSSPSTQSSESDKKAKKSKSKPAAKKAASDKMAKGVAQQVAKQGLVGDKDSANGMSDISQSATGSALWSLPSAPSTAAHVPAFRPARPWAVAPSIDTINTTSPFAQHMAKAQDTAERTSSFSVPYTLPPMILSVPAQAAGDSVATSQLAQTDAPSFTMPINGDADHQSGSTDTTTDAMAAQYSAQSNQPIDASLFPHIPPPVGANGAPLEIAPSRRGQKVKGRPTPKNPPAPKPKVARNPKVKVPEPTNQELMNFVPRRKQPFKPHVEYPDYPPPEATLPEDLSMYDVCQQYPNSLRENNLYPFIQREWSANEIFACFPKPIQDILNARTGKDKTMIYQKRLERVKKDLIALEEYDDLMAQEPLREDGRPTWIKRGNVRRK